MVLAHAFGARYELPIPLLAFVVGGALVVLVSFVIVFNRQVARSAHELTELPDGAHVRGLHPVAGVLSLIGLAFLVFCGFAGSQEVPENIVPTSFWILIWVAVPILVALIGDWSQPVNPFAFLAKLADRPGLRATLLGGEHPLPWPGWLGWWPAVVLFAFAVCCELIFNLTATVPHVTALALTIYAVFSALAGFMFGRPWLERGEMWTVLLDTWGRVGYFRFGAPGRRGFLGGFDRPFSRSFSRVVFVLLMLVNVNYDGLLSTPQWANDVERNLPGSWGTPGSGLETFRVFAFVASVVVLMTLFGLFARESARLGRHGTGFLGALAELLPSVVPIALGYLIAHYLQYLLVNSQLMAPLIGNPIGRTSWPIHLPYPFNDKYEVNHTFLPPSFYWYVAVAVIIAVHVAAVVVAHRHLATRAPDEASARRSEYPWLVAMVGYTMLSLWLLAQPFTKDTATTSASSPEHGPHAVAQLVV
ncbi:MAG TPA: hypothetical protein VFH66_12780 [Mycobacteriales bacterium]|nr:hypothetical protein [Mycobacteriales bacterium]